MIEPGIRRDILAAPMMQASAATDSVVAAGDHVPAAWISARIRGRSSLGTPAICKTKEVADLRAGDENGNSIREPDHDRTGNEPDRRTHSGHAKCDEDAAGEHGAHEQAIDAVARGDAGDDDDEGAGWAADLYPRAAEERNQAAGDDRAIKAGLRTEA